jgi:hypothetical protein
MDALLEEDKFVIDKELEDAKKQAPLDVHYHLPLRYSSSDWEGESSNEGSRVI